MSIGLAVYPSHGLPLEAVVSESQQQKSAVDALPHFSFPIHLSEYLGLADDKFDHRMVPLRHDL